MELVTGPAVVLIAVSFFAFLAGAILRKWPDRVQAYVGDLDGFALFFTPETYRSMISLCGWTLSVLSLIALIAAGLVA